MADQIDTIAEVTGDNLSLETVYDIPVQITVILGRTSMQVNQLLKLGRGAVVELDKKVGEPIEIFVNNRLVARGEVVVVVPEQLSRIFCTKKSRERKGRKTKLVWNRFRDSSIIQVSVMLKSAKVETVFKSYLSSYF